MNNVTIQSTKTNYVVYSIYVQNHKFLKEIPGGYEFSWLENEIKLSNKSITYIDLVLRKGLWGSGESGLLSKS